MATRMQQRRGTAAQWTAANPILAAGEIGFETDTSKFKMGNGSSTWSALTYFANAAELAAIIDGAPALLNTLDELALALGDDPAFLTTIATNLSNHATDTTDIHGITNTADLVTTTILSNHNTDTSNVHGITDTLVLATLSGTQTLTNKTLVTPLGIVKGDVGLGLVDNTSDLDKTVSTATQTALDLKANLASPTFTGTVTLPAGTITSGMIADGTIATADIAQEAVTTGKIADAAITAIKIATGAVSQDAVGLGNVNNTSDANKPISTATQAALDTKAVHTSPAFSGIPTAPTATAGTNTTQIATTEFVGTAVSDLVAAAPGTLNTLNELATALGSDAAFSTTVTNSIATKAPIASPTFTGVVTIPEGASISGFAKTVDPTFVGTVTIPAGASISGYATLDSPTFSGTVNGITKTMVGLSNVDNTSDVNKVISTATQTALDLKLSSATAATTYAPLASPTFTGAPTLGAGGIIFTDGTQTKEGVPSRTPIIQKTEGYTLSLPTERDSLIEISSATGVTLTIPTNATVAYPVGASIDILQTGAGQVTIAGAAGVTVNATPGLKLRTQWSSATLMKRATDSWIVVGDLTA